MSQDVRETRVPVPGGELHVEERGSGRPVVFIHGFTLDARMWDRQVDAMGEGFRTVRYDARGFGRSSMPEAPYAHTDDLAGVLDHLGVRGAALVGHSMGGRIAVNFCLRFPDRVDALALVDSDLHGFAFSDALLERITDVAQLARSRGVPDAVRRWLSDPLLAVEDREVVEELRAIIGGYSGFHWLHESVENDWRLPSSADRLWEIRVPTLIVVGERDLPDFHAISVALNDGIAGSRKATVAGAGHLANMEKPEELNRLLRELLASTETPEGEGAAGTD